MQQANMWAVGFHNVAEILPAGSGGYYLCRVPQSVRAGLNELAQSRALEATCCEVRFNLLGEQAEIVLQMDDKPALVEVYCGAFFLDWHVVGTEPTVIPIARSTRAHLLPAAQGAKPSAFDPSLMRVVLPRRPVVRLLDITGDVVAPRCDQVPAQRYLAYGSSITQGRHSLGPSDSFPARVARVLDADVINLGFGGSAHCELVLAEYIAGRADWDFATLEIGINMVEWMPASDFAARVAAFLAAISRSQRDRWVFVIDMFRYFDDLTPGETRQQTFRQIVADAVFDLDHPRLVHVSGLDLLPGWHGLGGDVLHPSPDGMARIAQQLSAAIRRACGDTTAE